MVAVATDMSVPDDIDTMRIEVTTNGVTRHSIDYQIGAGNLLLPGTLALVAGEQTDPVTIRVAGQRERGWQTLRTAVTDLPRDSRIATLHMPIQWLCTGDDSVDPDSVNDDDPESSCDDGDTCIAGACVSEEVDLEDLPEFDADEVFGGGSGGGDGDGACFDTLGCFAEGRGVTSAEFDIEECEISGVDLDSLNVAMLTARGSGGICPEDDESAPCLVPMDRDAQTGWRSRGDRVALPSAVCRRIAEGRLISLALTHSCPSKTRSNPTCGEWSSVGADDDFTASTPTLGTLTDLSRPGGAPDAGTPPPREDGFVLLSNFSSGALDAGDDGGWYYVGSSGIANPVVSNALGEDDGVLVYSHGDSLGDSLFLALDAQSLVALGVLDLRSVDLSDFGALQFDARLEGDFDGTLRLEVSAYGPRHVSTEFGGDCDVDDECPTPPTVVIELEGGEDFVTYRIDFSDFAEEDRGFDPENVMGFGFFTDDAAFVDGDVNVLFDDVGLVLATETPSPRPATGGAGGAGGGTSQGGSANGGSPAGGAGGTGPAGGAGGEPGNAGSGGRAGAGGAPPVADPFVELTPNGAGYVDESSNPFAIRGSWYTFTDCPSSPEDCTTQTPLDGIVPYANGQACVSGATAVVNDDAEFGAKFGSYLAFDLRAPLVDGDPPEIFDGIQAGIESLRIELTGIPANSPVRVGFSAVDQQSNNPFVEISADGTYDIPLADLLEPPWVADRTQLDIARLVAIRIQIPSLRDETVVYGNLCVGEFGFVVGDGEQPGSGATGEPAPDEAFVDIQRLTDFDAPVGAPGSTNPPEFDLVTPMDGNGYITFDVPFDGADQQFAWNVDLSPSIVDGAGQLLVGRVRLRSGFTDSGAVQLYAFSDAWSGVLASYTTVNRSGWVLYSLDLDEGADGFDPSQINAVGVSLNTGEGGDDATPATFDVDFIGLRDKPLDLASGNDVDFVLGNYVFDDGASTGFVYANQPGELCMRGRVEEAGDGFENYGAGIGMVLGDTFGNFDPFDAEIYDVQSLQFAITGVPTTTTIRAGITEHGDELPYIRFGYIDGDLDADGVYTTPLSFFEQPDWDNSMGFGIPPDAANLQDLQFQVVSTRDEAHDYDFCVHDVVWLDSQGLPVDPSGGPPL